MTYADRCTGLGLVAVLSAAVALLAPMDLEARQEEGPRLPTEGDEASMEAPPKRMSVVRVERDALRLDGRLDDDAWGRASFHTDFRQRGRDHGFDPRVETAVAFVYDDEALYVAARMQRDSREGVGALIGARDEAGNAERILVSLDTYRDRSTAYTFGVTRGGVRVDFVQSRDREGWRDETFDPVWRARVSSDSAGWTAEMRIPFSQLRFSPADDQVWGLNVRRWNPATYLNLYWVMVPYTEAGWASRFGELHGLADISGGAGAEILPYVVQHATYLDSYYGGDGKAQVETRVGGDLKMGLGSNLTLDATVNPDFGQVEADPARVNLTAFETYFPERRPFFLEGRELFQTPGPMWFYSRRIGSSPPAAVEQRLFEQVEAATILGGARLTGRLPSGLSLAALGTATDEAHLPGGGGEPILAAPRTAFGVLRLKQDMGRGGSSVGVLGTVMERFQAEGGHMASLLPGRAVAGGGDFVLRLGSGIYEVTGFGGGSRISGTPSAIGHRQRASSRYFQRPDARHVSLDPARTVLTGWTAGASVGRVGGVGLKWNAEISAASPGFEILDVGHQRRADIVDFRAGLSYEVRDGGGDLRNRTFGVAFDGGWNFAGTRRAAAPSVFWSAGWSNQWTTYVEVGMQDEALSDVLTRGGPLMATPRTWWSSARLSSGRTGRTWWTVEGYGSRDAFDGRLESVNGGITLQAGRRLGFSLFAGGLRADDSRQFLRRVEGGPEATFGSRYVFSSLERTELFAQLRTEVAFATDAVLTLYAEPFVSSGRTHDFGELTAARAGSLRPYGTDGTSITRLDDGAYQVVDGADTFRIENLDFWVRSFRGSATLEWEWWPGSFLHLVWRKEQWFWNPRDRSTGTDDLIHAFDDPGMNVFLAKVSFLLGSR